MDNQHRRIAGYRDLTQDEIDLMNRIKAKAEEVGAPVDEITRYARGMTSIGAEARRWAAVGKTDLQTGFMALVRSVARPTTF